MRTQLFRVGLIVLGLLLLSAAGVFAYWFYFRDTTSFMSASSLDQIELIPRIQLEFRNETFFKNWNEHVFSGKSDYKIELDESGEAFLHASSQGTSSVQLRQVSIPLSERPFLTWEWKATHFPSGKKNQKLGARSDNDFAARVYAIFGGGLPFNSEVIQYVWDEHFPEGTAASGAFSNKTKILVVQSGKSASASEWVSEKRDLAMDYQKLFGKTLKGNLAVVGFMSDSDNTGTRSDAYLRRLQIKIPKDPALFLGAEGAKENQKGPLIAQLFGSVRNGVQNGVQNGVKTSSKWFETLKDQIQNQMNRSF